MAVKPRLLQGYSLRPRILYHPPPQLADVIYREKVFERMKPKSAPVGKDNLIPVIGQKSQKRHRLNVPAIYGIEIPSKPDLEIAFQESCFIYSPVQPTGHLHIFR